MCKNLCIWVILVQLLQLVYSDGPSIRQTLWLPLLNMSQMDIDQWFLPQYMQWANITGKLANQAINEECRQDIRSALEAFNQRQTWAFQLFNSWGRMIPSGFFRGTLTDYGDYDQCLSIQNPLFSQYCLADFAFALPQPVPEHHNLHHPTLDLLPNASESIGSNGKLANFLNNGSIYRHLQQSSSIFYYAYIEMAICLPKKCTQSDIRTILTTDFNGIGLKLKNLSCQNKESTKGWNLAQTLAILLIMVIATLSLAACILDWFLSKNKCHSGAEAFLLCFSPVRNVRKLMSTESGEDLTCIHGLRFISIVWIIMGHTIDWNNLNVYRDTFTIRDSLTDWKKQPLFRAHFAVETFFYISGLLTSYMTLKYTLASYGKFNHLSYLLLRYIRLTPQLVAFMLLSTILPVLFDGPLWITYNNRMIGQCNRTWWHNLIYMQNLIENENICALHTWFLAADMQLHWLALVPMVILLKNKSTGIKFTKGLVMLFTLTTGAIIYLARLPPGYVVTTKSDFLDEQGKPGELVKFFHKSWNHGNVFFVGFLLGTYLYANKDYGKMKKSTKYCLWSLALIGYLFCIYSNSYWLSGNPYQPLWSAVIFPMNRLVWALMLTLVIWLCVSQNNIMIGRLLSWPALRPLSRMTYAVYLVHAWVFTIAIGTKRDLIDIRATSMVLLWTSIIVGSFVVAFFFTIFFESPFINMMSYARQKLLIDNNQKESCNASLTIDKNVATELLKVESG